MSDEQKFPQALKIQVALELLTGLTGCGEACWRYHLDPSVLEHWRVEFLQKSPALFAKAPGTDDTGQQAAELERLATWLKRNDPN